MAVEENRTAAFPITVTLQYIGRTSGLEEGSTLGGDDGGSGDSSGDAGATTVSVGAVTATGAMTAAAAGAASPRTTPQTGTARETTAGSPSPRLAAAFGADTVGSPGSISPPFPFVSLLLAFVFLVPMNFLIQAYGSSVLDERTNRRGSPLLVTPLSPVDIVAGRRCRTSRSRRSSRRSSRSPSAAGRSR